MPRFTRSVGYLLTVFLCICTACKGIPKVDGLLEREVAGPHITSQQLRVLVNEYVVYSAHRIEVCADKVLAENPDVAVRRNALLWKINGIAASFKAAARHDPLGAYLDLWVLNRQFTHLCESPAGGGLFGAWQNTVIAECHALEERLESISQIVSTDPRFGRQFVEKFASDFPLNGLYFDREPMASRYIEQIKTPSKELFQVVASLDSNLDDLRKLTVLYAEHLPKQARWEAELFFMDAAQLQVVQQPMHDLTLATAAVMRIADTTQQLPAMVDEQLRRLSEQVTEERTATLRDVDAMRIQTLSQLGVERSLLMASIREEREASFDSLRDERIAVTQEMKSELSRAIEAADTITRNRSVEFVQFAPKVIDHFFWRTWQIFLVFALVVAVLGWRLVSLKFHREIPRQELTTQTTDDASIRAFPYGNEPRKAA